MKKITIVGCGNIGSRHLQAISQIKESLEINIVEPDEKSRKAALERLEEISFDASNQKYTWDVYDEYLYIPPRFHSSPTFSY